MRFALVTTFYPPYNFGGDGIFVRQLALALAARGHEVEVVHCADAHRALAQHDPSPETADGPRDAGVTVHRLESRLGRLSPLLTHQTGRPWLKGRRLRRILGRGFDVIHYHNVSLVGGPGVLELGEGLKLYTLHEYWLLCPTHLLFRYDGVPCEEHRCLRCQLAHGRPPQAWRRTGLLARALQRVDACIAPSRFAAERHARELGRPFVHLPNFVPEVDEPGPAIEVDARPEPDLTTPYVLYVGRMEPPKGVESLVRFFLGWRGARLLLVGAGRQAAALEALARGAPHVSFLGAWPRDRLGKLYRGALAVVVPSLCYELCPLVVLEAFRAGVPVVVRDVGSLPELVADGRGLVYRSDAELAAHLDRLRADPASVQALGRRAREAYERHFTPDVHLRRYLGIVAAAREAREGRPP
jgi:glycosyltransferase involved in cell wall biosynthesis